jgi:hypothetical protein
MVWSKEFEVCERERSVGKARITASAVAVFVK